ncbi:hypothetical protein ACFW3Z_20970 [Nocardiopsis alba]|uniref:hypothetical protein n=1 Tax=Nocardiopsis alba TaxID=53437 RepID=UPI00366B6665
MKPVETPPTRIISGNDGAVNTGEGSQYSDASVHHGTGDINHHHHYSLPGEAARFAMDDRGRLRRPRTVVASQRLEELRAHYVAPPGYDEERRRRELDEHGVLVLTGPPGVGRRTCAQLTLVPKGSEGLVDLREVQVEVDPRPTLDAGEIQEGERLMVELTGLTCSVSELRTSLVSLASQAQNVKARLILLAEEEDVRDLPDELRERSVTLRRPHGTKVLYRHLVRYGLLPDHRHESTVLPLELPLLPGPVVEWLGRASMSEIEGLARRAGEDHQSEGGRVGLGERLERALGQGHPAADKAVAEAEGRGRAILLAAAFLEGAELDRHSAAVERLLPIVRTPENETPPLERAGFTEEIARVGVTLDEERRIGFSSPGYGRAVREAFWDSYPHLQGEFAAWIDTCLDDSGLSPVDRDAVAERWAGQALRAQRLEELFERVYKWSFEHGPQAALLLSSVLEDTRHGGAARQQIYRWARTEALPGATAYVLVAVCSEVLVTTHPDQALVRLHHLAGNKDPDAAAAARSALLRLAEDPFLYRRLLRRVSNKLAGPDRRNRPIDGDLFEDLTTPARLVDGPRPQARRPDVGAWTRAGLPVVLFRDAAAASRYCERLLEHPGALADILARWLVTAAMDSGRLSSLYAAALRWASGGESGSRRSRADALLRHIDAAQGLDLSPRPLA